MRYFSTSCRLIHLCVPSPGPYPYDELRQSILNFYGAAYRPLPEVDHTVRDASRPAPSRLAEMSRVQAMT